MKIWAFLFVFFGVISTSQSLEFSFKYSQGSSYRILSEVEEDVKVNQIFSHHAYILNKVSQEILKVENNTATIKSNYTISDEVLDRTSSYKIANEYEVIYTRDAQGRMIVPKNAWVPTVRNIPSFPKQDLKIGDEWTLEGSEIHDLRKIGLMNPLEYPIRVFYTYLGPSKDEPNLEVIEANYNIFYRYPIDVNAATNQARQVSGYSSQTLYWNREKGRLEKYEEKFYIAIEFQGGKTMQFEGNAKAKLLEAKEQNNEVLKKDLQEAIKELPNVSIKEDDKGITLSLDKIQFKPDSAELMPEEIAKLAKIAEILKKYPENDLLIGGHTALAGTVEGRQKLSEDRAQSVGNYLLSQNVRSRDRIITKGFGSNIPVAPNDTEENRSLNRRVEITILKN